MIKAAATEREVCTNENWKLKRERVNKKIRS